MQQMQVLRDIADLAQIQQPLVLAFGVFDGVHVGHQEVIRSAMTHARDMEARLVVFTFSPHPVRVLQPERAPKLLCSLNHELLLLERLGVETTLVCAFDQELAATPAEDFLRKVLQHTPALRAIYVGETWRFGKQRGGDLSLLQRMGAEHGFTAHGVQPVELGGAVVSSTAIRQAVQRGDFSTAHDLLGRPYSVYGVVQRGRQLGRQLGFPTANVDVENEQLPPLGVYAVRAKYGTRWHPAVANLGLRPTVNESEAVSLEVHLLNYDGNLYGEALEVRFVQHLRSEQKFPHLEALRAQIMKDCAAARAVLKG